MMMGKPMKVTRESCHEAEHEDHHTCDLNRVPQEDVDVLGDQVADHGGVRGGGGDEVPLEHRPLSSPLQ